MKGFTFTILLSRASWRKDTIPIFARDTSRDTISSRTLGYGSPPLRGWECDLSDSRQATNGCPVRGREARQRNHDEHKLEARSTLGDATRTRSSQVTAGRLERPAKES